MSGNTHFQHTPALPFIAAVLSKFFKMIQLEKKNNNNGGMLLCLDMNV